MGGWGEAIQAKIPELVSGGFSLKLRSPGSNYNGGRRNTPAIRILNDADKSSSGGLGSRFQGEQRHKHGKENHGSNRTSSDPTPDAGAIRK
jgi:hypothetical protein